MFLESETALDISLSVEAGLIHSIRVVGRVGIANNYSI